MSYEIQGSKAKQLGSKLIWAVAVPIIVAIITAFVLAHFKKIGILSDKPEGQRQQIVGVEWIFHETFGFGSDSGKLRRSGKIHFLKGGSFEVVRDQTPQDLESGDWSLQGEKLQFSSQNKFIVYKGTIDDSGATIEGIATNQRGDTWAWKATRGDLQVD